MANTFSSRNTLKTKLLAAINAAGSADQIVKLSRSIEKANLDDDADLETALDTKVSTLAAAADPEDLEKLAFGVKKLRTPEGAGVPTSTMVAEGSSNLYVTQDRVRGSFSASGDLSYDSGTGVLSYTALPDALTVYATVADLPASGVTAGAKGIVEENKKLYVFTGASWIGVGLVDQKPSFNTNPDGSYSLTPGGDTVITLSATDPQGDPITYSHQVTAGSLSGSSVSQADNVFTITGSTNPADTASFSITFSASDGTNVSTTTPSEFTVQFGTDWSSLSYLEDLPSVGSFLGIGLDADDNSVIYTDRNYLNGAGGPNVGQRNSRGMNIDVSTSSSSFATPVNQYHGYPNSSTLDWSDYGSISNPSWYGLDQPAVFNQSPVLTENYVAASSNYVMNASGKAGAMFVYNRNTGGGGLTGDTSAQVGTLHATIENVGGVTGAEYTESYPGQKSWGANGMDFVESHPIHGDIAVFSTSVSYNDPNTGGGAVQSYGPAGNHSTGNLGYCEVVKLSDTSKANRVGIFNNEISHDTGNPVMFGNQHRNGVCISPTTDHVAIAHPEALGGADYLSGSYGQTNMAYAHIGSAFNNYNNPSNGEYIKKEGRIGIYNLSTGALVRTISPESVPMNSRYLGTYSSDNNTYNKVMGSEFGYKGIKADSTGFVACGKQPSAPWANTYASGWYRGYPTWDVIFEKYSWSTGQLLWKCEVEVGNWGLDTSLDTETGMFDMFNGYIAMWVYCKPGETPANKTNTTRTSQIVIINSTTGTIEKRLDVGNYQFGAWNIASNSNSAFISSYQGGVDRYSI